MGQKVHPVGMRLGLRGWDTELYADRRHYADRLQATLRIRSFLQAELLNAGVSRIKIKYLNGAFQVLIYSARLGIVLGNKGERIEKIRMRLSAAIGLPVQLKVLEVTKTDLEASLNAEMIARMLEKRVAFRRAMRRVVTSALRAGGKGVKVCVSGRLGGAEIARTEWYREGRLPLHTFRADIDYGFSEAKTTYGVIGVKVWIYKGDQVPESNQNTKTETLV